MTGNSDFLAAGLTGTENRSCTGGLAFARSVAGSVAGAGLAGLAGVGFGVETGAGVEV
ncbi:MAG TPA: hypothetical protein VFN25_03505 [Dokdonella sp.]|nr:hypothetical protein [Dokdonella sp.]